MSNPFVAEIRIFAGSFAPTAWALCDGQVLPISQNTALFSLLGTTYGGNGTTNFALPNMQGCAPMQAGQGPGLTPRNLGETAGEQNVTLLQSEMPAHSHSAQCVASQTSATSSPANSLWCGMQRGFGTAYAATNAVAMNPLGTSVVGGSLPHNNMPPYLGVTFIIALQGIFPARS
jgi:microcystin-dependent protein